MLVTDNALTTLEAAKAYLKISDDSEDTLIESLIDAATAQIEGYCRRNLKERTYTDEEYDGTDQSSLLLKQFPVSSVSSIKIDGVAVDPSEFKIKKEIGSLIRLSSKWPEGILNITASYTAGYEPVPADLDLACKHLVMFYYKTDISNFSKTFGDGVVVRPEAIPGQIKMLLAPYRKVY